MNGLTTTTSEYNQLLETIQKRTRDIKKAVTHLQAQQPGNESNPHLKEILESAEEIYGIAFINLPEFSPEER